MGAEILETAGGSLTVRISGVLTQPDLADVQKAAAYQIEREGAVSILVVAEGFQGWNRGDKWGGVSFQWEYDSRIKKMAIVCDEEWKDLALLFTGQGVREVPIEHFLPAEEDKARAWLNQNQPA